MSEHEIATLLRAVPGLIVIATGLWCASYRDAIISALALNLLFHLIVTVAGLVQVNTAMMIGASFGTVIWVAAVHSARKGLTGLSRYIRSRFSWGGPKHVLLSIAKDNIKPPDQPADRIDLADTSIWMRRIARIGIPILALVVLVWWLATPHSMDRWVMLDGSLACQRRSDSELVAYSSSPRVRRLWVGQLIERGDCLAVLANERVRLLQVSNDGTVAEAIIYRDGQRRWIIVSDISLKGSQLLAWPWFPDRDFLPILLKFN